MRGAVAAADADIVDQDVEAAEAGVGLLHDPRAVSGPGDVGADRMRCPALLRHQGGGLLGPLGQAIDAEHLRTLAREEQRHGAAVADGLPRRLAGADHHRGLAFEATHHVSSP